MKVRCPTSPIFVMHASFSMKQFLNLHTKYVHEGKKPHNCNVCDVSFAQKGHLNGHIKSVHEGKKPLLCNLCGSSFIAKEDLKISS